MAKSLRYGIVASLFLCGPMAGHAADVFPIERFEIAGNTLLPREEIEALLAPLTGQREAGFGHIQQAIEALEAAYRRRGYAAVTVSSPEQELTGGTVRLQVSESVLGEISVPSGLKFFDTANLLRSLPALQAGKPPNTRDISRQLELANENPARQVEVVLGAGVREGVLDARLKVDETDPVKFIVGLENTGTIPTGSSRLTLAVQHANLFESDHQVTAAYVTSVERPERVQVASLSYRIPLYELGDAVDLTWGTSNVDAGNTPTGFGTLAFSGKGEVMALRYTHILPRQGEYTSRLIFGWDYKNYDNSCSLGGFACGSAGADVILRPVSVTYSAQLVSPGRATEYSVSLATNVPGGDSGSGAAFSLARPSPLGGSGAPASYYVVRGNAAHLMALEGGWQLRGALGAQWSEKPLLPYEQFGLAGSTAVRGFLEREVARDRGIVANFEAYTPDIAREAGIDSGNLRAVAFLDAGIGGNKLLDGETQPKNSLSSIGVGLRYGLGKNLSAKLDLAHVLDGNETRQSGTYRGHFNLMLSF